MPKLNDVWGFKDDGKGVFYYIEDLFTQDVPEWLDDVTSLDAIYHLNHSGNKMISPMLETLYEEYQSPTIPSGAKSFIANIIWKKYNKNWARLWDLYIAEYDPLENYYLDETETPDITRTHAGSITHSVSDDYKVNSKITTETDIVVSGNTESDGYTYGFNNSSPVPTDTGDLKTTERTIADPEHNITDTETTQEGETVDDHDFTDTETGPRGLVRRGQIGILTYRQMIEGEIELWKWNFYDSVMRDIDSLLTLSVYEYNKYER